jgi:hypothetical protein
MKYWLIKEILKEKFLLLTMIGTSIVTFSAIIFFLNSAHLSLNLTPEYEKYPALFFAVNAVVG